jgi:hypothetical protein
LLRFFADAKNEVAEGMRVKMQLLTSPRWNDVGNLNSPASISNHYCAGAQQYCSKMAKVQLRTVLHPP